VSLAATDTVLKQWLVNHMLKISGKVPLADNTVGRRLSDISEDLCDQLIDQLKTLFRTASR
jgi:hypothetical protein